MRLIERLHEYLVFNGITPYAFENTCGLSNGYLGKQLKAKGAVGSDILERIKENYTDLSLVWLVTGKGHMLLSPPATRNERYSSELQEEQQLYFTSKDEVIKLLNKQIVKLETSIADKDKIIQLLETELHQHRHKKSR
jgi:hypothetical protein